MVEDKYIGLALAVSSSLAIGTSFIITKKVGQQRSAQHLPCSPDTRASTTLENEALIIRRHPTVYRICEILYGGQEYQRVRLFEHT
jgi:hypothetical protein